MASERDIERDWVTSWAWTHDVALSVEARDTLTHELIVRRKADKQEPTNGTTGGESRNQAGASTEVFKASGSATSHTSSSAGLPNRLDAGRSTEVVSKSQFKRVTAQGGSPVMANEDRRSGKERRINTGSTPTKWFARRPTDRRTAAGHPITQAADHGFSTENTGEQNKAALERAMSAAQPIGEPVAWQCKRDMAVEYVYDAESADRAANPTGIGPYGPRGAWKVTPLYAHPAPVAPDMVMVPRAFLASMKQTHNYCEDSWYSCPKAEGGCSNESEGSDCNCGADGINAKIDEMLAASQTGKGEKS